MTVVDNKLASSLLEAVSTSASVDEFCKQLTHKALRNYDSIGSIVFLVTVEGHIHPIGACGIWKIDKENPLHTSSKSIISECIRKDPPKECISKSDLLTRNAGEIFEIVGAEHYLFLSLSTSPSTVGLLVLGFMNDENVNSLNSQEKDLIRQATQYVSSDSKRFPFNSSSKAAASKIGGDNEVLSTLTSRQVSIISLMKQGLTNAQIGRQLHLSESTIKQESVRIFRYLGVSNRRDAVAASKSLRSVQRELNDV